MGIQLYDYQIKAIGQMFNGCILNGGVGSGKSRTAIGYYYVQSGGDPMSLRGEWYSMMDKKKMKDLYIITTARKRDTLEWEHELVPYLLSKHPESTPYDIKITIDSWNNIQKYKFTRDAFFIFDEQRVVGSGMWVKAFLKIAKANDWILLTATAGDTWQDYIPVFIANGFYRTRQEFIDEHVVYSRYRKYKIDRYININRLIRLRDKLLIDMEFERHTISNNIDVFCEYDMVEYKTTIKKRWNSKKNKPIKNAAELCYELRRIVNSDKSRIEKVREIVKTRKKAIIFYNYDYELDILKGGRYGKNVEIAEWNGHKHQPIPENDEWIYLVQYNAGAEGWNCIKTNTIIFYSLNYSYKVIIQASGRIDRLNTPYTDLYFYSMKTRSSIDLAIATAIKEKRNFNEGKFDRR